MFSHRARPLEAPSEVDAFGCGQPGTTVDQEAGSGKASPGGRGLNTVVCFHAGPIIAWSGWCPESRLETKSYLSVPHLETSPGSIIPRCL